MTQERQRQRARELGIEVGVLPPGPLNAITDVTGVMVGHQTLMRGDSIRTGVTVIVPHDGNLFQEKVPAAVFIGNGFGKMAGFPQIKELGTMESPIALTNTLSVSAAIEGLLRYTLASPGNASVTSVNAVVGETHDGFLNDIRGMHLKAEDVLAALHVAASGPVAEGSVGAGAGTSCFTFKGGIGTSSRRVAMKSGVYTVGVLVQSNYDGELTINGAPVGRELHEARAKNSGATNSGDGSCMIVIATDAPLDARNLERLAARGILGLAKTGSCMQNGSGDFAIAFSTAYRITDNDTELTIPVALVGNRSMNSLFQAAVEATEEALYNSLFMATSVTGHRGNKRDAIPLDQVVEICARHKMLSLKK